MDDSEALTFHQCRICEERFLEYCGLEIHCKIHIKNENEVESKGEEYVIHGEAMEDSEESVASDFSVKHEEDAESNEVHGEVSGYIEVINYADNSKKTVECALNVKKETFVDLVEDSIDNISSVIEEDVAGSIDLSYKNETDDDGDDDDNNDDQVEKRKTTSINDYCQDLTKIRDSSSNGLKLKTKLSTFECPNCSYKTIGKKHDFIEHLKSHLGKTRINNKAFKADHCYFRDLPIIGETLDNEKNPGKKTAATVIWFKCPICCRTFTNQNDFFVHYQSHLKKKIFNCYICVCKDFTIDELHEHYKSHLSFNPCLCFVCGQIFPVLSAVQTHINRTHVGYNPCLCKICGKIFPSLNAVQTHNVTTFSHVEYNSCACYICENIFPTLTAMQTHIDKNHTGSNSFICQNCGQSFTTLAAVREHIKRQHVVKPFKCEICDKAFVKKCNLHKHMIVHSMKSNVSKRHICIKYM